MPSLLYSLEQAPQDATLVGGKALGLAKLAGLGLPVPPGFVLTAEAFRMFLRENGLDDELSVLAVEEGVDEGVLSRLRDASWPAGLRSAVEFAYGTLCRPSEIAVAVRSSATAEDGAGASFAGQHLTLLNVTGSTAVLDAVLACWASLYGETAVHYRKTRGVDDEAPAMAVVVQALVPSEVSGVAFTLDPVSGDRDVVLIEGAWGLGEGVVAGLVTPDHFLVRKSDGAIVRKQISTKELRVVQSADGGTSNETLSGELARRAVLSDEQAVELARLAASVEERFGAPQDIEWAYANGQFYVLQARPITAFAGDAKPAVDPALAVAAPPVIEPPPAVATPLAVVAPPPVETKIEPLPEEWVSEFDTETAPTTIWTSANVQEVLPDQMSPFSAALNMEMIERFGVLPMDQMGIKLTTTDGFFAFFYGRPFLNISMMIDVADQTPFGSVEVIMEQYFGQHRDEVDIEVPSKRFSFRRLLRYCIVAPRMIWFTLRMPAEVRRAEKIVAKLDALDAAHPFDKMSDEDLLVTMDNGSIRGGEVSIIHVSGGGLTSSNFEWLRTLTERWLGDKDGVLQARLCTGLGPVESAQPAYELWDLSRLVLESEALRRAFEPSDGEEIARRLDGLSEGESAAFHARMAGFLSKHGHRSVMEAEPAALSWAEDRPAVYAMMRNYLHARPEADPRVIEGRQRHERDEATKDALHRLRFWQRPIFRNTLRQAQKWVVMREHTKSLMVRGIDRGRRITRELARRLVVRGRLDDVFDLYYLTIDETKALTRGALDATEARVRIVRRKKEEERNKQVALPETFQGRPKPLRADQQPLPEGRILRGIPVSPGRVTGRARVIFDPRRDASIEPGEILVAPVTDAGWTPLFVVASGIVVDVGGSLSHGSTVAREYGLPAVVNVKHGTRMIQNGQTITVDGTLGVVILDGDPSPLLDGPDPSLRSG